MLLRGDLLGVFELVNKLFGSKKTKEDKKWNKMWDLWVEDKIPSPYKELMTYQSEINNGGHDQYFTNVDNTGEIAQEVRALSNILPPDLLQNLHQAREAYCDLEYGFCVEDEELERAEMELERCDNVFYANEQEINRILQEYASRLEL